MISTWVACTAQELTKLPGERKPVATCGRCHGRRASIISVERKSGLWRSHYFHDRSGHREDKLGK